MITNPVTELKGVGPETATNLAELGIHTIEDLLNHLPFRYEDIRLRDLSTVEHEERVTVQGVVHSEPSLMYHGRRKNRLTIHLLVGRYLVKVTFFNRGYLKAKLSPQDIITVSGKWDKHRQVITGSDIKFGEQVSEVDFEPVYPLRGSIKTKTLRRFIADGFKQYADEIKETLPQVLQDKYKLLDRRTAIEAIHFPKDEMMLKQARRRFVYEELLYFQLKMQALRKVKREESGGVKQNYDVVRLREMIASLPYTLTDAQKRVVNEICADIKSPYRMNRLLQGDVGSGKTAVAAISLYASITAGYQGALMVPTEILAEQHYQSIQAMLEPFSIQVGLLTSSVKGKKRMQLLEQLAAGEINILIGTHALIQDDVHFKHLGLVITDEQHRFGVEQRKVLREKGVQPDVLFMTATPIPRTLAITAFGEMDVSTIDQMPSGRKQIETYWMKHDALERILQFIQAELNKGRQAYVICPLIEESETLDVQNAIDVYNSLVHYYGDAFSIGLMHGKLPAAEKEEAMREFTAGNTQVLVSTTVVEVGVNVPNATVMVIYDAERFGLSQLHQLRGRVGRGDEQSYCILLADPKSENGKERMRIMTETNDGFVLSERDLELRGPGDFFGKKQSGLPEFKMADLVHDYRILEVARNDATELIASSQFWDDPKYAILRESLEQSGILTDNQFD